MSECKHNVTARLPRTTHTGVVVTVQSCTACGAVVSESMERPSLQQLPWAPVDDTPVAFKALAERVAKLERAIKKLGARHNCVAPDICAVCAVINSVEEKYL